MRDIDLTKTLADADEHELLIRYGQLVGLREAGAMTRSVEIECHHQILYAVGKMRDLKARMEANYHRGEPTNWSKVVEDSLEAMTDLAGLIVYARTGKGGTSYLGDRNR